MAAGAQVHDGGTQQDQVDEGSHGDEPQTPSWLSRKISQRQTGQEKHPEPDLAGDDDGQDHKAPLRWYARATPKVAQMYYHKERAEEN